MVLKVMIVVDIIWIIWENYNNFIDGSDKDRDEKINTIHKIKIATNIFKVLELIIGDYPITTTTTNNTNNLNNNNNKNNNNNNNNNNDKVCRPNYNVVGVVMEIILFLLLF